MIAATEVSVGQPVLINDCRAERGRKDHASQTLRRKGNDFGESINPDDIVLELQGSYDERVRQAQTIADRRRDACIEARRSFSFETVMSHPSKIDVLARAKAAGFYVQLSLLALTIHKRTSMVCGFGLRREVAMCPSTKSHHGGTAPWRSP